MSDTIATRISTVCRVKGGARQRALGPMLLSVGVAEGARRLLAPRAKAIEPAPIKLEEYFSAEEIERGSRFARPQLALGMVRSALDLEAVSLLVRRSPS